MIENKSGFNPESSTNSSEPTEERETELNKASIDQLVSYFKNGIDAEGLLTSEQELKQTLILLFAEAEKNIVEMATES